MGPTDWGPTDLGPRIWDLVTHLPFLKKKHKGLYNLRFFRELHPCGKETLKNRGGEVRDRRPQKGRLSRTMAW